MAHRPVQSLRGALSHRRIGGRLNAAAVSFLGELAAAVGSAHSLPEAVTVFARATAPHLKAAITQWQLPQPQPQSLDVFVTVVLGGLEAGVPTFRELTVVNRADRLIWEPSDAIRSEPAHTDVGLNGALAPAAVRRTSWWNMRHLYDNVLGA